MLHGEAVEMLEILDAQEVSTGDDAESCRSRRKPRGKSSREVVKLVDRFRERISRG